MRPERRPSADPSEWRKEGEAPDHPLVQDAIEDALSRLPVNHARETRNRVINGIRNRLGPAIIENSIIQEQLSSPQFQFYVSKEIIPFLNGAKVGASPCPDGRLNVYYTIGDPDVVVFHQRLAGEPETRPSTSSKGQEYVLGDPNIIGSMVDSIERRRETYGDDVELVEILGPHINSGEPLNGCGALKIRIGKTQHPSFGMRFGGIDTYYQNLGNGFYAFNHTAEKILGAKATTFDISHDIWSQGLVFGLRNMVQFFKEKSLRENLLDKHEDGVIIMTEMLADEFHDRIEQKDTELNPNYGQVNPLDPHKLAENIMRIGRIAKELTLEEETSGYPLVKNKDLIANNTPTANRVLAYTLLRNVVFRQLAQIKTGGHNLLGHNERWVRIGASGPINVDHVPFILRTPSGVLRDQDIEEAFALEGILRDALEHIGVKPYDEAAVLMTTEEYDPNMYRDQRIAKREYEIAYSTAGNNAARIRNKRREDINNGVLVVLSALIDPDNNYSEIVK